MAEENLTTEQAETVEIAENQEQNQAPASRNNNDQGKKKPFKKKRSRRGGAETQEKEFLEEVLQIDRVTRVVKGGRRLRFRATVIIGDRKGRVGVGIGKSAEVVGGIQKAVKNAKKSLMEVAMENGTIPHAVKIKYKSSRLLLMPGREGSGIIAGGATRKICDLAGIENIVAKSLGTNNRLVNAQATIKALQKLQVEPKKKVEKENNQEKAQKNDKQGEKKAVQKAPHAKKEKTAE